MLVHLKPKRQSKRNQVMESYIQKANWNYRLSNPIHCKKSQTSSRIKQFLTQKVSTQGKSIDPTKSVSPKYTQYSIDTSSLKKNSKNRTKQLYEDDKKKLELPQKTAVIQLSTLYKKSFKYNTTIHQIIKNLTKNYDSKNSKQGYQIDQAQIKDVVKSQPILVGHEQECCEREEFESPVKQRLKKLETIKNQCSMLERMDEKQQDKYCHVNHLRFIDNTEDKNLMKVSLYQWRMNKPHFTKLKWRKYSITKKKLVGQNPGLEKIKVIENQETDQNYLNSMFYPLKQDDGIFTAYNNSNTTDHYISKQSEQSSVSRQINQQQKGVGLARTQRSFGRTQRTKVQKNLKTVRDHKISLRHGSIHNSQFSLDAWNTKEKEQFELLNSLLL